MEGKKQNKINALIGVISGFINGIFGGGGGMVVVPLMEKFDKLQEKNAHATAILIILPLSVLSSIVYASFGKFDFKIGVPVIIGVVLGGLIGAKLLNKFNSKIINVIFSVVMFLAGLEMVF